MSISKQKAMSSGFLVEVIGAGFIRELCAKPATRSKVSGPTGRNSLLAWRCFELSRLQRVGWNRDQLKPKEELVVQEKMAIPGCSCSARQPLCRLPTPGTLQPTRSQLARAASSSATAPHLRFASTRRLTEKTRSN